MINKIMKIEMAELGSAESVGPPYSLSDWVSECDCEWLTHWVSVTAKWTIINCEHNYYNYDYDWVWATIGIAMRWIMNDLNYLLSVFCFYFY